MRLLPTAGFMSTPPCLGVARPRCAVAQIGCVAMLHFIEGKYFVLGVLDELNRLVAERDEVNDYSADGTKTYRLWDTRLVHTPSSGLQ